MFSDIQVGDLLVLHSGRVLTITNLCYDNSQYCIQARRNKTNYYYNKIGKPLSNENTIQSIIKKEHFKLLEPGVCSFIKPINLLVDYNYINHLFKTERATINSASLLIIRSSKTESISKKEQKLLGILK